MHLRWFELDARPASTAIRLRQREGLLLQFASTVGGPRQHCDATHARHRQLGSPAQPLIRARGWRLTKLCVLSVLAVVSADLDASDTLAASVRDPGNRQLLSG